MITINPIRLSNALPVHLAHIQMVRPCVYAHSVQTAKAARIIALVATPDRDPEIAYAAGLLHDIGKLIIPESIIQKQGPLNEAEWQIVQQHPGTGAALLDGLPVTQVIADAVRQHHELPDGSGYPAGLKLRDICPLATIINLADRFAAMTEDRSYRPAFAPEYVTEIICNDAKAFFPKNHIQILNALVQYLRLGCQPQNLKMDSMSDYQFSSLGI